MITTGKEFFSQLNQYIKQAQKELLISTFKLEAGKGSEYKPLQSTLNLLTKQAQKGLPIKIICPGPPQKSSIARQNSAMIGRLARAGVDFRHKSGYSSLHAKIFIIDRQILAIGSHNFSRGSCACNWEMSLFSMQPSHIIAATDRFLAAWDSMED